MKLVLAIIAVSLGIAASIHVHADSALTRHVAKVKTFTALLRITEERPDAADATRAAITVGSCRRVGSGYLCRGSLKPVSFSGIDGTTCTFTVAVYPHSVKVTPIGTCV